MRRSEPNASAKKPRVSSGAVNRVYWGGASGGAPGGAGCWSDAADAATVMVISTMQAVKDRAMCRSGVPPLANQAFLRHRGNQRSFALEYKPARIAARSVQVG